jgi:protein tyrosine/serine phosphatase
MPRFLRRLLVVVIVGLLIAGPYAYWRHRETTLRGFRVVQDGVLYRSGQLSLGGLKRVIHDYAIKTVVTLRDASHPGDGPPDLEEELYCNAKELNYVRIPPRSWWASDGSVPADEGVRRFREIMADPSNYPVLVHCFGGLHRTGAFCAIYRMEHGHWTNAQAIAEMKACGYRNIDDEWDLLGYLEHYRPTWLSAEEPGPANMHTESHYRADARALPPVAKRRKLRPGKSAFGKPGW